VRVQLTKVVQDIGVGVFRHASSIDVDGPVGVPMVVRQTDGSGAVCGVISSRRGSQNPVLYWPWQVRRGCTD